jgi:Na+/H+ antiporter NhaD/arsenite permease-like protein
VLVFFAAMFVVTSALWSSGAISMLMLHIPSPNPNNIVQSNTIISVVSILLSQILSNVPFVALYNLVLQALVLQNAYIIQSCNIRL